MDTRDSCLFLSIHFFSNSTTSSPFQVYRIFPNDWKDVKSLEELRMMSEESGESEVLLVDCTKWFIERILIMKQILD